MKCPYVQSYAKIHDETANVRVKGPYIQAHALSQVPRSGDQAVCRSVPSALAIHGVCIVLWVGSPWDPKYMLLLTFTTLSPLSIREPKSGLHKSRYPKNLYRPFPDLSLPIGSSSMSPLIHSLWQYRNVPPQIIVAARLDFLGGIFGFSMNIPSRQISQK